jgi:hypothetical protein
LNVASQWMEIVQNVVEKEEVEMRIVEVFGE